MKAHLLQDRGDCPWTRFCRDIENDTARVGDLNMTKDNLFINKNFPLDLHMHIYQASERHIIDLLRNDPKLLIVTQCQKLDSEH